MKLALSTGSSGVWFFSCSVSSVRNELSAKLPPAVDRMLLPLPVVPPRGLVPRGLVVVLMRSSRSGPEVESLCGDVAGADDRPRAGVVALVQSRGTAAAEVRVGTAVAALLRVHLGVRDLQALLGQRLLERLEVLLQQRRQVVSGGADRQPHA